MSTSRRQFLKTATIGGVGFASGSGIFFPKPAESYSLNYRLSFDGRADKVFGNFIQANIARNASRALPSATDPAIMAVVESVQREFVTRQFIENQTPFSQRLGNLNQPLWGQQRTESVGPNPGFGTVQVIENIPKAISFTGSTTAGIDQSLQVLSADRKLTARELDDAVVPIQERFEDWGTWAGDVNPTTGEVNPTSLTTYETRIGSVTRRYTVEEPGPRGHGTIRFDIRGGRRLNERLFIRVDFV